VVHSSTAWRWQVAAVAILVATAASVFGLGAAPSGAVAPSAGVVSISASCYDDEYSSILAVLTSPLGVVQGVSGTLSAWATDPLSSAQYGGELSMTEAVGAITHVFPGTYTVQLSAQDVNGTTYSYSGTMVLSGCGTAFAGIQADPDPDGGYFTFTNSASVLSHGANHATDDPSFLVTDAHAPVVAAAAVATSSDTDSDTDSYYFAASDGGVFCVNAPFYGSAAGLGLHAPIVAMALTPDHGGYWLVGSDGGVFTFGDAVYYGSMGGQPLSQPIVGMAVDEATGGYWLVGRDGGVFAFHAPFDGSAGALHLDQPIVGMESAPGGTGYRLVASDGGVFSYDEPFYGSMAGGHLAAPIVGITEDPTTGGYWMASSDGGVFAFNAPFYGTAGTSPG
jgi:hypothetical protein